MAPEMEEMVENCKAKSNTCKNEIEALEKSPEKWRIEKGAAGSCVSAGFRAGCTTHNPGGGGTVRIIPSEFSLFATPAVPVNSVAVIGHELGHALTDKIAECNRPEAEVCAKQHENAVRKDVGLPARP